MDSARRGAEARAFVPASDFARSQQFYLDLGFAREFAQADLAGFRLGSTAFLLQNFHVPEHTANFQMHLTLADLDGFWAKLQRDSLAERYGVRAEPPSVKPWGLKDMVLFDPSGVLWRIAQRLELPT
ncbi:MAG: glyoxalase [Burkholderiales bacterium PBB5]|nr:MAG: glyoxalase [Burkholderiales bacterium PBB5]